MALVDSAKLFRDGYSFPWEFLGLTRPAVGSLHSAICLAVAGYHRSPLCDFLRGSPAMFELRRAARVYGGVLVDIINYCEKPPDRGSLADKTVWFLAKYEPVVREITKITDKKLREGAVHVPRDWLTLEGEVYFGYAKNRRGLPQ